MSGFIALLVTTKVGIDVMGKWSNLIIEVPLALTHACITTFTTNHTTRIFICIYIRYFAIWACSNLSLEPHSKTVVVECAS